MPRLRAAIYTRKSTEDGLDQAFNSLDAQREACAAYIVSQRHEGWVEAPDHFDDGGFSGGNMERPGLGGLLDAVRQQKVDVIVVYKVDRLTRSLADFAKIVELLDAHKVSFVSVTQQFNTTSSMGLLTLNVLLSFAQFEREVAAERIRDKIAASKKKGLWTGGPVPLGYDIKDKALVPNPIEAETVSRLYQIYLEVGSVRELKVAADTAGIVTKRRKGKGARAGGNPFSRGALYGLLANHVYTGRIAYKGEVYEGRHPAIVDRALWDRVQAKLKAAAPERRSTEYIASRPCLAGIIFDETGDRLTPAQAIKAGKRCRYYVSSRLHLGRDRSGWRLSGPMLEDLVIGVLRGRLADPAKLICQLPAHDLSSDVFAQIANAAVSLGHKLMSPDRAVSEKTIMAIVERIDLAPTVVQIQVRPDALGLADLPSDALKIEEPVQLRRRGVEAKLLMRSGEKPSEPDAKLIAFVARSFRWRDRLVQDGQSSLSELGAAEGVSRWDISRHLPLAFLAPDIVNAILHGRQPIGLTVNKLKHALPLPLDWKDQRKCLGFDT